MVDSLHCRGPIRKRSLLFPIQKIPPPSSTLPACLLVCSSAATFFFFFGLSRLHQPLPASSKANFFFIVWFGLHLWLCVARRWSRNTPLHL